MNRVTSADGTEIAWQARGNGPALVIVVGAFCDSSSSEGLTDLLESHFTVYEYDRRGRGQSRDMGSCSTKKEAEDLAAVISVTGETDAPLVYGHSSGGIIAMEAAAMRIPMRAIVAFEPPFTSMDGEPHHELLRTVEDALLADDLDGAAKAFLRGSGAPEPVIDMMSKSGGWTHMRALAPTLASDLALSNGGVVPAHRYAKIRTGLTLLWGGNSPVWAAHAAAAVKAVVPGARTQEVPGQNHAVHHEPIAHILRTAFPTEPTVPAAEGLS
jgi:pimeloyl-ACP methyl ester carboxylesterase